MGLNGITRQFGPERASGVLRLGPKSSTSLKVLAVVRPAEVRAARAEGLGKDMMVSAMGPPPLGERPEAKVTTWKR